MRSLIDRTREFSLRIIRLYSALPKHRVAQVLGNQLLRAGTSPGAHFREALRARSKAEYVAKLNSGLMELEETLYWLELLAGAEIIPRERLAPPDPGDDELIAIFVSLIRKWRKP
ncbi:MAG TPA: four helix bundle protein [Thermoanaerobaculia bacterium]|nr:four helix bundle protein [Thermoanaerobaculia bacterium]